MKRRRKSSVERTSPDSVKEEEETSEHGDDDEVGTSSAGFELLDTSETCSPMERRRAESSDLSFDRESDEFPMPAIGSILEEPLYDESNPVRPPHQMSFPFVIARMLSETETTNQGRFCSLTEEPQAGCSIELLRAEQTLPIFPPLLALRPPTPALSLPPNVSSPTVTSASTADTSSANLDFSLSHQDESHSQYVGPFSQSGASYIPAFVPQSENVSTERPPEPFDLLEPPCLKYSRQDTAGNQDEIMESVGHVSDSVPNRSASADLLLPSASGLRRRVRSNSSPSVLCPLIHQDPPPDVSILPRAASLPSMKLQSSFEEFTPGFCGDPDDETYRFQCSGPGLYQCRVSGLVFAMKGGGDVFYRVVPWNRTLLSPHGKKPAGPLFDISCLQQSVAQLHLPHCEVRSTGPCHFLSVAHLHDGGVEFIRPERITETHIIISISGFSAFGNVKDEDSPADPVRALVLLFYRPAADPGVTSFLNLLLLPANVVIRELKRTRKKLFGPETFIDAPPNCKLHPKETYSLSTSPAGESVLVQPAEAEFDPESYNSYFTSIQVILNSIIGDIKLSVKQAKTSCCVWESRVCLVAHRLKPGLPSDQQLKETRTRIIDGISEPVLQSLLDKLLEKKVLSDSEREAVEAEKIRGDKARVLIDTVRRKGDAAGSEMIRFLCELDPFLCRHVGLICEKVEPNQ